MEFAFFDDGFFNLNASIANSAQLLSIVYNFCQRSLKLGAFDYNNCDFVLMKKKATTIL